MRRGEDFCQKPGEMQGVDKGWGPGAPVYIKLAAQSYSQKSAGGTVDARAPCKSGNAIACVSMVIQARTHTSTQVTRTHVMTET